MIEADALEPGRAWSTPTTVPVCSKGTPPSAGHERDSAAQEGRGDDRIADSHGVISVQIAVVSQSAGLQPCRLAGLTLLPDGGG
jgi:hypothetical protein